MTTVAISLYFLGLIICADALDFDFSDRVSILMIIFWPFVAIVIAAVLLAKFINKVVNKS
jgi:hypothetical protein